MIAEREGSRRDPWATLAVVAIFVALAAGVRLHRRLARHPTPERCAAMLERYADQDARARGVVPVGRPIAPGSPEVARCTRELTDDEISCALGAGYVDALERCLPSSP